jgi:hypothetical protein
MTEGQAIGVSPVSMGSPVARLTKRLSRQM